MNTKNVITWFVPIILFIINICVTYILPQFYNKNNDRQLGYLIFYLILVILIFLFCWIYSLFSNRKNLLIFLLFLFFTSFLYV